MYVFGVLYTFFDSIQSSEGESSVSDSSYSSTNPWAQHLSLPKSVHLSVLTWECLPVCPYLRVSTCLSLPERVYLSVLTWECPVSSQGPSVQQSAASLRGLLDGCSSGPALSDVWGWSSELRPEKNILPLRSDILTHWRSENKELWVLEIILARTSSRYQPSSLTWS